MDIGVSTACLYPLETEKALYELAKRGIKNVKEVFIASLDAEDELYIQKKGEKGVFGKSGGKGRGGIQWKNLTKLAKISMSRRGTVNGIRSLISA